ncbi:1,2-dihydroxy-3-keto-5-methylthiopentene dioxygenase [Trichonephila inaurata madagascariensis]|uniref:Acireductone dioxygenase n=1 Tax=Trichonephila inaurata madagascariensis TaxID=2747483 RepID=A0A8X6XGC7_9ARAC|nr:1,2-dihydroxy-3-keto-5-methylthiopentene dioxygenase [Trichonephila inaurata madagascariensis]GFY52167.1 1,2-dihydroxy-3-keto-5-methylthiopentene dioxygenase [Trichonephila inaurata madagascariensis]
MPQAWYMDDSSENPRSEHHLNPPQFVQIEKLYDLSGVEYWHVDVDNIEKEEQFAELKKSRGYDYEDLCEVSREALPDYDEKIKAFSTEHLHTDEEIRLFLAGSGYFDIRDKYDKWIRIKVSKGDLLVLPAGIYHRFTLDMGVCIRSF